MISKNAIISYSHLLKKRFRRDGKKFLAEGIKTVLEGIKSNYKCEIIFVTNEFVELNKNIISEINKFNLRIEIIRNQDFLKLCDTITPQGIAAVFLIPDKKDVQSKPESSDIIVCLEDISDPGNMGTIIRNCNWFGINEIILSVNCTDIYNPKCIRSSMGSIFHLSIYENIDLPNEISKLKDDGYKIVCADLNGTNVFKYNRSGKTAIIFSNEANGPSDIILSLSDEKVTIPRIGNAESLNVASASAIILSTLTR